MNEYSPIKRTIIAVSFLAIIIAVSPFESGCSAGNASDLGTGLEDLNTGYEGSWIGEVRKASGDWTVVSLTLYPPGKATGGKSTLTYVDPRACTLTAEFLKDDGDNGRVYSFVESTGGFCDRLLLGKLALRRQDDNVLSCELTSRDDESSTKISEKGTLRRQTGK